MSTQYSFTIAWSEDDEEYMARCPAFPGLTAFGRTEEEALKEGTLALAGFVETYKAQNKPLPKPDAV